jgi:hypothetical protein
MSISRFNTVRSKWCALPALGLVVISLIPQIHFWSVRGSQWHGAYAMQQGDETYYSAYINALIDGRPRRTDPARGQDDSPKAPLPESLFSIQFIPPYAIAFFAREFGASASTAFIVLMGAAAFLASLSVFWLLASVTGDNKLAAAGVLIVLCLGALAAGQGWIGIIFRPGARFSGLPFLRRYLPSAPFPLFFVFCTLIWRALTTTTKRNAIVSGGLAGLIFAVLIFSYFYLWTAAAAWFVCIVLLWLLLRPHEWRSITRLCISAGFPVILALAFYFYLLSHLPPALGKTQVLTLERWPDFLRVPELIGILILVLLILSVRRKKLSPSQPITIFAASFALLPFLVFNQQVLTGRSVQPYHYEVFIANYAVLMGLVLTVKLLRPDLSRRPLIVMASLCFVWGVIEVNQPFKERSTFDVTNDQTVPVLLRLKELAYEDGTWVGLREKGQTPALVFSPQTEISRLLPTWAPQGSLLQIGSASFQSLSVGESRNAIFTHFYYCGRSPEFVRELLNDRVKDLLLTYYTKSTLFGPERVLAFLGTDFQPIRQDEIESEVLNYKAFVDSFSRDQVVQRSITYAVTLSDGEFDFSHIDLWYERDAGARVGVYVLYHLRPRTDK